jgi:hypothetical protein
MRILLGNTEIRTIYQNFELLNLHLNSPDRSHLQYVEYLKQQRFIPPAETHYFEHTATNVLPDAPSTTTGKGSFNIFPVSLTGEEINRSNSSSLGKS